LNESLHYGLKGMVIIMKKLIDNFDLKQIAESGQCFRWKLISENDNEQTYMIPAFGKALYVSQKGNEFDFSCSEEEWESIWKSYFDIDRDYAKLGEKILASDDEHLKECYALGSGIRILKQDLWEMVFSFMVSQNNNIARISATIEKVCEACGKPAIADNTESRNYFVSDNDNNFKEDNKSRGDNESGNDKSRGDNESGNNKSRDDNESGNDKSRNDNKSCNYDNSSDDKKCFPVYRFPNWDEIPEEIFDDRSFGFGYRNDYLRKICQELCIDPEWLEKLRKMSYEDAMKALLAKKGIGVKVANCISLFGLSHIGAFPVDTHIKQLLEKYYPNGLDLSRYEGEAGIIQQYLFYYELKYK